MIEYTHITEVSASLRAVLLIGAVWVTALVAFVTLMRRARP
jgi:hypothetical protein